MLEEIIAKALETEVEVASLIAREQDQCVAEENKANRLAQEAITECQNHLRQSLLDDVEIQEKENEKRLQLYVQKQEEDLKTFLTQRHTQIQEVSEILCNLICATNLRLEENLPDA